MRTKRSSSSRSNRNRQGGSPVKRSRISRSPKSTVKKKQRVGTDAAAEVQEKGNVSRFGTSSPTNNRKNDQSFSVLSLNTSLDKRSSPGRKPLNTRKRLKKAQVGLVGPRHIPSNIERYSKAPGRVYSVEAGGTRSFIWQDSTNSKKLMIDRIGFSDDGRSDLANDLLAIQAANLPGIKEGEPTDVIIKDGTIDFFDQDIVINAITDVYIESPELIFEDSVTIGDKGSKRNRIADESGEEPVDGGDNGRGGASNSNQRKRSINKRQKISNRSQGGGSSKQNSFGAGGAGDKPPGRDNDKKGEDDRVFFNDDQEDENKKKRKNVDSEGDESKDGDGREKKRIKDKSKEKAKKTPQKSKSPRLAANNSPIRGNENNEKNRAVARRRKRKQEAPKKKNNEKTDSETIANFDYQSFIEGETVFTYKTDGQPPRVYVKDESGLLKEKLDLGRKHYIDLSYHQHVKLFELEFEKFSNLVSNRGIDRAILYEIFSNIIDGETIEDGEKEGTFKVIGEYPLSKIVGFMMSKYGEVHYKRVLKKTDDTSSTRIYEHEFVNKLFASESIPFSMKRALTLPEVEGSKELSMVNSLGATLDSNVPIASNRVGEGKVYSAIYSHFKKMIEIINIEIDKEIADEGVDVDFIQRTLRHKNELSKFSMQAVLENETERFQNPNKESAFSSVKELQDTINQVERVIDKAIEEVDSYINKSEEKPSKVVQIKSLNEYFLKEMKSLVGKKIQLLGVFLGLYIKVHKRLLVNEFLLLEYDIEQNPNKERSKILPENIIPIIIHNIEVLRLTEDSLNSLLEANIEQINRSKKEKKNAQEAKREADLKTIRQDFIKSRNLRSRQEGK